MTCKICESQTTKEHIFKERMFGLEDRFEYLECLDCGCLQIKSLPDDMRPFYGASYYSMGAFDESFAKTKRFRRKTNRIEKLLRTPSQKIEGDYSIFTQLKPHKSDSILDVGCGAGEFLYHLKQLGFEDIMGIDPFLEKDIHYSNGLKIKKQDITQVDKKFDLIILNHSLEHMPTPKIVLRELTSRLNSEGKILIRVPIVGYGWKKYGEYHFGIDAPRHFFLFTPKAMEIMTQGTNLKIKKIIYDSVWDYIAQSEKYLKGKKFSDRHYNGPLERIFFKLKKRKWEKITERLNQEGLSDQAGFILQLQ